VISLTTDPGWWEDEDTVAYERRLLDVVRDEDRDF
jgi:hypothetical protein